jgi:hypothetical protein
MLARLITVHSMISIYYTDCILRYILQFLLYVLVHNYY